eukprot:595718-Pyramimonas_sp.AAC.1
MYTSGFCQYGTPWQKNTSLLAFGCPELSTIKRCVMSRGRCSATNEKHEQIVGQSAVGKFKTLVAQPCPQLFVEHICELLFKRFA